MKTNNDELFYRTKRVEQLFAREEEELQQQAFKNETSLSVFHSSFIISSVLRRAFSL